MGLFDGRSSIGSGGGLSAAERDEYMETLEEMLLAVDCEEFEAVEVIYKPNPWSDSPPPGQEQDDASVTMAIRKVRPGEPSCSGVFDDVFVTRYDAEDIERIRGKYYRRPGESG
ncbi:hypothetical protein ACFQH6_10630 [Halobacteriaceae archaeon GCM10025711]